MGLLSSWLTFPLRDQGNKDDLQEEQRDLRAEREKKKKKKNGIRGKGQGNMEQKQAWLGDEIKFSILLKLWRTKPVAARVELDSREFHRGETAGVCLLGAISKGIDLSAGAAEDRPDDVVSPRFVSPVGNLQTTENSL